VTDLLRGFRWQDGVDIALLAVGIYSVLNLIRGTRAVPMLIALGMVYGLYIVSDRLEIYTVNLLLSNVLGWAIVIVVIVFQNDIRRMLAQVGSGPLFSRQVRAAQVQAVEEVVKAVGQLANAGVGALVVLENEIGLGEYVDAGTPIDARVTRELLVSIFVPGSPVHDGALVIQHGRIMAAGCLLPLTTNPNLSKTLGTRHRAAIGLTEECDAIVLVVSEEDGTISVVHQGTITRDVDPGTLRVTLQRLLI
jgi:diadenylate cyclase